MREERFEGAFRRGAFPSWRSKADGARGAQSVAAPKTEGPPGEAVFGACANLAPAEHRSRDGKAPAVLAGFSVGGGHA